MSTAEKKKRKRGDRRDARLVKTPGLQTIMGYLLPKRTDCEVYLHDTYDITKLLKYLEKKNAEHPEYKTTIFHCVIAAVARMIKERPVMNRFVQGYRTYERDEISLSFVAKRRFADEAEEALLVLKAKDEDNIDSISKYIVGDVKEMRKSEHSTGGVDALMDKLAKVPRPLLAIFVKFVKILDFWGINPEALTEGDPNYTTVLLSNLGSIKCPAVYHHLNNYGTNSIMLTIGAYYEQEQILKDGSREMHTLIDIGATLDERIGDGFYFARSLKLMHYIFENPELLDKAIGESSNFDYK